MTRKKRRKAGVQYGGINRNIFQQVKGDPGISRKMLRAAKKRKRLAKAGEFGMQIVFSPECFLVNPIEDVKKYLSRFLGVNLSLAIRDRVVIDERGPDGKHMGPFFNTGGMWQGFQPKGNEKTVRAQFFRSSFSSSFLLAELRKDPSITMRDLKRLAKARRAGRVMEGMQFGGGGVVGGYEVNYRNRLKAISALNSQKVKGAARGREILEPTDQEHKAIMNYLEDLLQMRTMIGDVSGIRPKLRKARAKRLVQALGQIRAPMVRF
jgi:hypothetical protein